MSSTNASGGLTAPASDKSPAMSAARALADGWVTHLARWSPQASPAVLAFAHRLSMATSAGQVCLRLPEEHRPEVLHALLDSGLARRNDEAAITPLVVDPEGRVYLARFHDLETRLARRIVQALAPPPQVISRSVLEQVAGWFDTSPDNLEHEQFAAVRMALRNRLTLISGGPGTGKTTTLANLLAGLLLQHPELRIALAAPTGKAAARMLDALAHRAAHLPESIQARLPRQATTLHRLIGAPAHGGRARFDERRPLPIDVLVIDEASMLDLALATAVLEALPESTRIILLGDRHQLAAVEAGAVFAELSSLGSRLEDQAIVLSRSFRFAADSGIGRMAQAARDGQTDQVLAHLGKTGIDWIDLEGPRALEQIMHRIETALQPYRVALRSALNQPIDRDSLQAIEQALLSFRVLCALRHGPFGTERLNSEISDWLRNHGAPFTRPGSPQDWFAGRAVLLTRNDPATGLFNGDLGIALPDPTGTLRVYFPHLTRHTNTLIDTQGDHDRPKGLPIERLPDHETAFAMTVHKSQGSEFENVLLILSDARASILTRELLYTGITRAKSHATLVTSTSGLRAATERPTERLSGLADQVMQGLHQANAPTRVPPATPDRTD